MKSSVILLGAVMSFIKPFAPERCPHVWVRPRRRLPWLQCSSSLWSMQSKTSSQRQRRGMQCARFRQRNSSSRHSFTQPICQEKESTGVKAVRPFSGAPPEYSLMFEWITGYCGLGKRVFWWMELAAERGRGVGGALTSSEPSRQLSCPSHRRLADTQPPLAHTYSLTEHVGRTGKAARVSQLAEWSLSTALKVWAASQKTGLFRAHSCIKLCSCAWRHVPEMVLHLFLNHSYSK